jgi:hypothetical protein
MGKKRSSPIKGDSYRVTVKAIRRDSPDARGMARALIGLGMTQYKTEQALKLKKLRKRRNSKKNHHGKRTR